MRGLPPLRFFQAMIQSGGKQRDQVNVASFPDSVRSCPIANGGLPDRFEAHRYVEGFGYEVWRIDIHLANDPIMSSFPRRGKEVVIQKPGNPRPRAELKTIMRSM